LTTFAGLAAEIARVVPPRGVLVRVVAVDGCGGAGKSTFAAKLGAALHAPVVSTDEFASWSHPLDWYPRVVEELLRPLSEGRPAIYRRSEWGGGESIVATVEPTPTLVLEGVSSSRRAFDDFLAYRIWILTDPRIRLQRGLERDGVAMREQWLEWMANEDAYVAEERPQERADLVISGTDSGPDVAVLRGTI
jgi:uridine kinase